MELLNSICTGLESAARCRSSSGSSCTVLAVGSSLLHCLLVRGAGDLHPALGSGHPLPNQLEGGRMCRGTTVSLVDFR